MNKVVSPITLNTDVVLIRKIKTKKIIALYNAYNIDVSKYFENLSEIYIYQCNQTGYQFYYPFNLSGDDKFYQHFQNFDWYYMPWKWEHEIATKYIRNGMDLLEVGCAHGAFLERANQLFDLGNSIGLELNESAKIKNGSWQIINETVQDFSIQNHRNFDIVCSFQVLEHIDDINSFLGANIKCLKTGGKLIVCVPNNNSYLKYIEAALNMPPHHMGLWTSESLRALVDIFPIKLVDIHIEDLKEYHLDSYIWAHKYNFKNNYFAKIVRKIDMLTGRYNKFKSELNGKREALMGHSILVVFEKL